MGRRNEANRLKHNKKIDQKRKKEQEALANRKEKLKEIVNQANKLKNCE